MLGDVEADKSLVVGEARDNVTESAKVPPSNELKVISKNLQRGVIPTLRKFMRQTFALTSKNLKLSFRNSTATLAQLWIGVLFLILILIIGAAIRATSRNDTTFIDTKTSDDRNGTYTIKDCIPGKGLPCYNFAYASSRGPSYRDDTAIEALVDTIAAKLGVSNARNVSGGILALPVVMNTSAIEEWILNNPNVTRSIFIFENSHQWGPIPTSEFRYVYRSNSTRNCKEILIYKCNEPWLEYHIPMISAANAAFMSLYGGDPSTRLVVSFSNFPHPDLPASFDAMKEFGTLFIYIALTFNYVILLTTIVREKELHLVDSMRQMGMTNSAYWLSWIISATIINTLMVFLIMLFGVILQFELFLETDGQLLLTILWLTAESFTAIALFFSSFIHSTSTARLVGVLVFIITFIAAPLLYSAYYTNPTEDYNSARWAVSIFPFFSFYHALQTVIDRSSGSLQSGMTWEQRTENLLPPSSENLHPTFWSVESSLKWLVASFFIFTLLAWYIDQIIPNDFGRSKYPWFFLQPSYWGLNIGCCRRKSGVKGKDIAAHAPVFDENTDEDVKVEANAVYENQLQPAPAVVLRGVTKKFGWRKPFWAVNRVFYNMNYGQLTAILGHNGSGKSTTFNMLTGLSTVTDGDAEIFGRSVSEDMSELHASMGVCPQHDVLWDQLTAREHLELFSKIKGLNGSIQAESKSRLSQVKLISAADSQVGGFSGGMRRRLSIAIAMLGDPSIVFLDEPTTGMDPVTRREVLEMISESKRDDRVIVLTSHAMEEVEMLADKVVVMSHGRVQAVGTVVRLKKRFGLGYKMTMFGTEEAKIKEYFKSIATLATSKVSMNQKDGTVSVELPNDVDSSSLVSFFAKFENDKESLGVSEYSLSLSTLEEVFLNLSKSEEEREQKKLFQDTGIKHRLEECEAYQPVFKERNRVSTTAQINALFWKSFTFQMRNLGTCCNTILFPILIMILLIVLDRVVFLPEKVKAVCGNGVSTSECATKGPNLECAAKLMEFRPIVTPNEASIGVINGIGARGRSVNANCNSETCFRGLEKMESRGFPVSFDAASEMDPGTLNYSYTTPEAQSLFEWHADLLFIADSGLANCQKAYDDAFSTDSCPTSPASARAQCIEDRRLLTETKQYWDSKKQQTSATFGIGACLTTAAGTAKIPSDEYTSRYNATETALAQCKLVLQTTKTLPHFSKFNVSAAIASTTKAATGLMDSLSFQPLLNTDLKELNTQVHRIAEALGPEVFGSLAAYLAVRSAWYDSIGADPLDYQLLPSIEQMCNSPAYTIQLGLITGPQRTAVCDVFSNLDKVRGASTKSFSTDRAALDLDIYNSWFGTEVQTQYMKTEAPTTLPGSLIYKERQYHSKVSAFHIRNYNASHLDVVIYHNKTAKGNDPITNWVQLVNVAESAFVKSETNRDIFMRYQEMPLKFKCNRDEWLKNPANTELECDILPSFLKVSIIDFVAIQLFPFIFFIYAFLVVNQIVYEKEQRLRVIMRMNGRLKNSVYWIITFWFFFVQFLLMSLLVFLLGRGAKLRFTTLHDAGVYWAFILSWGPLLMVFSFLISLFFSSSQSSTAGVFLFILVINLVGIQLVSNLIQDPFTNETSYAPLMWLPPFVMIRYILWMGLAGALGQAIHINELGTFAEGSLANSLAIMWGEFFACLILVWYLDNVYVAGFGTRKHPLFFLSRKYWTGERQGNDKELKEYSIPDSVKPLLTTIDNDDVKAEYERVIDENSSNMVVRVVRLSKEFDNGYMAVKSLSLGINENECFGLLGHNGAGKTTAISMLVGLFEPTSGTATVDGLSITNDMDAVQTRMGVCPQHDVCWGPLSVRDHLLFYGRLKGVPRSELALAVDKALFDVNLKKFEHRASSKLSGGMRRRLSTAMSLIGTPRVVYLDEPSTGLDPASKRALWNVIEKAKGNKSLVLTTHSMEEAEALCDRIGIMALGEMQCIGTAAQLKSRYGTGYTFFLAVKVGTVSDADVFAFVDSLFGSNNAKILGRGIGGTYKFEVARKSVVLSKVFAELENPTVRARMNVLDWSLTETTLEEVFLKLADMAHVDEALSAKPNGTRTRRFRCCNRTWSCDCCVRKSSSSSSDSKNDAEVTARSSMVISPPQQKQDDHNGVINSLQSTEHTNAIVDKV